MTAEVKQALLDAAVELEGWIKWGISNKATNKGEAARQTKLVARLRKLAEEK